MKLPRRNFLHLAAGAAALPAVSRFAWAQAYPTRPVRLIVGFPGGTTGDILIRLIGQWLSDWLGQPFIIENRPGAAGNVATEQVVEVADLMRAPLGLPSDRWTNRYGARCHAEDARPTQREGLHLLFAQGYGLRGPPRSCAQSARL